MLGVILKHLSMIFCTPITNPPTTKITEHNKHIEAIWSASFLLKNKRTKENQSKSLGQISTTN